MFSNVLTWLMGRNNGPADSAKVARAQLNLEALEPRVLLSDCTLGVAVAGVLGDGNDASGEGLYVTEHQVTSWATYETTPTLGNDGVTDLVVYTLAGLMPIGHLGQGDIWFQRLMDGAPVGSPVQVTDDSTDDKLNDLSGDYIVFTAYENTSSFTGRIMLYQISTGFLHSIGSATLIQEPRIHGACVVWREGGAGPTQVVMYDLAWIGSSQEAVVLAGPVPPTYTVEIGERFVVWSEYVDGQYDIAAFDLDNRVPIDITSTNASDERNPATSGPWIVWEAQDQGALTSRIEALNMDTAEARAVADNGVGNFRPSIDGDLIAYESNLQGNLDVYVYRLSTGKTFQVTTDANDQYHSDVFADLVAYVDQRTGNEDVYVSRLLEEGAVTVDPEGIVRIGGTSADDAITVTHDADNQHLEVTMNGSVVSNAVPLAHISEIRVWGLPGHDRIELVDLAFPSMLDGGDGDDWLEGGAGEDLIFGRAGADTLIGASGNDFLIGGVGSDRIVGSAGHDILVAGEVVSSFTELDLRRILGDWAADFADDDGASDDILDETVVGDTEYDKLTGSAGHDWFILSADDKITDLKKVNKDGDVVTYA